MIRRFQSAHAVLHSVKAKLALSATSAVAHSSHPQVLDEVVDILCDGRGYSWVGIYLAVQQDNATQVNSSAAPRLTGTARFPETKSEIAVPIRLGTSILGMIDVEVDRPNALHRQERVLLTQVAAVMAQYLTTSAGKLLLRQARKQPASQLAENSLPKGPQSARPEKNRAAAGARFNR